mgnify:CR=1 FL=1
MSTALDRIIAYKVDEVAAAKRETPLAALEARLPEASPPRGFAQSMSMIAGLDENALICELKRKSPSAGDILPGADPVQIAREYESGGAGSLEDFARIRSAVGLPMLRKDFMIDPYQVIESRVHGADCVLVIMACLSDAQASELTDTALDLGMDVLLETHNEEELARALRLPSPLIGINNRDLKRMVTDLGTTERLAPLVPAEKVLISESGVSSPEHIKRLRETGTRRFLIGESLMKMGINRHKSVTQMRVAGTN